MPDWIVPLADVRLSEQEVQVVAEVYRSGWLSQGPRVAAFERDFARFAGVAPDAAVALASGTAALELACVLAGLGPGHQVVVPSLTFAATAAAVLRCGARPVFADIGSARRPWLTPAAVEPVLTERTRAIVTVSYAGHPGEAAALRELADSRGLALIEDAAHAVDGWDGPRHAGTIGHLGTFSFFANKNLPLGEGGMLIASDPALAARARRLRSHGLSAGTWARHRGDAADYDVLEPGFNHRLDEARAALGSALLARLPADTERRREIVARYERAFQAIDAVAPGIDPVAGAAPAWHIFPVLLGPELDRAAFRERLAAAGVQTSVHYPPLHLTQAFSPFAGAGQLQLTESYAGRTVTLPLFAHMTEAQQMGVIDAVTAAAADLTA